MADRFLAKRSEDVRFGAPVRIGDARFLLVKDRAKNAPGYDGPNKCWPGYEKVEGKMRGERGSCKKKGSGKRKKRPSKTKKDAESSTDASSSDDEETKKKKAKKSD